MLLHGPWFVAHCSWFMAMTWPGAAGPEGCETMLKMGWASHIWWHIETLPLYHIMERSPKIQRCLQMVPDDSWMDPRSTKTISTKALKEFSDIFWTMTFDYPRSYTKSPEDSQRSRRNVNQLSVCGPLPENREVGRIYQISILCFLMDVKFISKLLEMFFMENVSSSNPHLRKM